MRNKKNAFYSPWLLIKEARTQLDRFDQQWRSFHERSFGIPMEVLDPQTFERVFKFRILPEIPEDLRLAASNCINNMRHALDQAINCASLELGSQENRAYFPIANDASNLDKVIKGNCKGVPPQLLDEIKGLKPYVGGDPFLGFLGAEAGPNKHRVVIDLDTGWTNILHTGPDGWFIRFKGPGTLFPNAGRNWCPTNQEVEVARVSTGGDIKLTYMTKPPIHISLYDGGRKEFMPAFAFLSECVNRVAEVLEFIEATTQRLKAAPHP